MAASMGTVFNITWGEWSREFMTANRTAEPTLQDIKSMPLYHASVLVWQIGLPSVIVTGTFGNVMIFLIQGRAPSGSDSSMSVYFISLAVIDTLRLWFDPIFWWMEAAFNVNALAFDMAACKLRVWMAYMTGQVSAWILVTMTFQRAASILWPHRVNVFCTRRFATLIMVFVFGVLIMVNAHILYGHSVRMHGNGTAGDCFFTYTSEDYGLFFQNTWGWIDTSLCAFFPFVLLLMSNTVLVRAVGQSVKEVKLQCLAGSQSRYFDSRRRKVSSMTVTLISVSVSFFILMTPMSVYMVYEDTFFRGADKDVVIAAARELVMSLVTILWLGDSSINFYIYCLTGSRYRAEMVSLFQSCLKQNRADAKPVLSSMSVVSTVSDQFEKNGTSNLRNS